MSVDNRIYNYKMEYYRAVYANSPMWNGEESLQGKRVIVYCEQGLGDIIHFIRYLPKLKSKGCHIILHCHEILHCLLPYFSGADEWWSKYDENLPPHDCHLLTLDLPFLMLDDKPVSMETWWEGKELSKYMPQITSGIPPVPYINFTERISLPDGFNIGICWAGNPLHHNNADRSCHLKHFRCLKGNLICLQKEFYDEYTSGAEDMFLMGTNLNNLVDTMRLINSVDAVVAIDSLIMHLAGALAKPTYALLGNKPDMRWPGEGRTPWYPTISFCKKTGENWASAFRQLPTSLLI